MFNLSCLLTLWMDNGHPGLADKDQLYVQHHAPSVPVGKISLGLRSQPSAHQGEILTNQSLAAKLNPKKLGKTRVGVCGFLHTQGWSWA